MDPIPLDELRRFDTTVRPLVPSGASEEQATEHLQRYVAHLDLAAGVPDGLRASYERLRTTYAYGVLYYDFYTIVHDLARLLPEQALRERFIIDHPDGAVFRHTSGDERTLTADSYENLHEQIRRLNRQRGWKLELGSGGVMYFDGMLTALTEWAREESLLHGQRNRRVENLLADMRNRVAHPTSYHRTMPGDAAHAIADSAEIVNRLWGHSGQGRMYPAPRRREIMIVGWAEAVAYAMHPDVELPGHVNTSTIDWVVVKADPDDDVLSFDALYETTRTPIELLWGPGSLADARHGVATNKPHADEVGLLDRSFLVRYHESRVELPRSPEIAAGLAETEMSSGEWILITADSPLEVFHHARQLLARGHGCAPSGYCKQCAVNTVARGGLADVMATIKTPVSPRIAPDLRVPGMRGWPRWNEVIEGSEDTPGQWFVPMP
jgi:hypothetical protein